MPSLNPTLWRTCKMLAGPTRIRLLRQIQAHPESGVTVLGRLAGIGGGLGPELVEIGGLRNALELVDLDASAAAEGNGFARFAGSNDSITRWRKIR